MPHRPHNRLARIISEEAATWYVCLREGRPSSCDRLKYVRWLKQSPLHVRAMLELAFLEGLLRRSDLSGMSPTPGKSGGSGAVGVVVEFPQQDRGKVPLKGQQLSSWQHWKLAASACLSRVMMAGRVIFKIVRICD